MMLCIFRGNKTIHAGIVRDAVLGHPQLPDPENNPTVHHAKEGRFINTLRYETLADARKRIKDIHTEKHLPFDPTTVKESDLDIELVARNKDPEPRDVYISPELKKPDGTPITLADFPEGHDFGNGVRTNFALPLKGGVSILVTTVVFPKGTILTDNHKSLLHNITGQ